jgi:hypothetical protein
MMQDCVARGFTWRDRDAWERDRAGWEHYRLR